MKKFLPITILSTIMLMSMLYPIHPIVAETRADRFSMTICNIVDTAFFDKLDSIVKTTHLRKAPVIKLLFFQKSSELINSGYRCAYIWPEADTIDTLRNVAIVAIGAAAPSNIDNGDLYVKFNNIMCTFNKSFLITGVVSENSNKFFSEKKLNRARIHSDWGWHTPIYIMMTPERIIYKYDYQKAIDRDSIYILFE